MIKAKSALLSDQQRDILAPPRRTYRGTTVPLLAVPLLHFVGEASRFSPSSAVARVCHVRLSCTLWLLLMAVTGSAPSSGEATSGSTGSTANKSKDVPRVDTVKSYSNSPLQCPIVPDVPITLPTLCLDPDSSSLLQLTNAAVFDGESEPIPRARTPPSAPISTSWSSPNLSWQLTSKLSNALLKNDTVVHRPKLSSHPTVKADQFKQPSDDQQTATSPKSPMSEVPSLPSSVLSPASSNAPLSQSTAPTSLVSSGAPSTLR